VLLPDPALAVERILREILGEERINSPFFQLWPQLEQNMLVASESDSKRNLWFQAFARRLMSMRIWAT
jgi:hypothetical protein